MFDLLILIVHKVLIPIWIIDANHDEDCFDAGTNLYESLLKRSSSGDAARKLGDLCEEVGVLVEFDFYRQARLYVEIARHQCISFDLGRANSRMAPNVSSY